jgi:hypothetical protein
MRGPPYAARPAVHRSRRSAALHTQPGAIGYNRGDHGKAAGLRTTMLVCLAASVAMLLVNLLLPLSGRADVRS